ncbi:hypothetical protein V501_08768 [Pseudogymnoascus sp. VKM F-4519 (FW-2642)]|nr:hypothetical protein V501_08768 [Pseudogymnoascus sp. VKM F-4519 (FW-2642)]
MAQPLSGSPSSSFFVMRPTAQSLPTSLAQQMNRASANSSAEVSARRSAGYGQPGLHTDQTVLLPPQGPSQIPGTYASAAEAWDPITTPAHSSRDFMSAGNRGQAHLLEGIAATDACQGTEAPLNTAGSSSPAANTTGATPRTRIKWRFNKRNFCKLLRKCFRRREKLESARWTIKGYMAADIQSAARIRDLEASNQDLKALNLFLEGRYMVLEARNLFLESTVDDLNDERQALWDARTNLEHMHQLDAEKLRQKDHLISTLLDSLTRRGL